MSDPHSSVQDFFSAISLSDYRKYLSSCLKAASSFHHWKKEDPGSLLYFQQKIDDLIDAAKRLTDKDGERKRRAEISPERIQQDIIDPDLYMCKSYAHTQWETFPRALSKKEFLNPYLAFNRFFRYRSQKEWHKDFKEIIFYALSPYSCTEDLADLDLLKINQLILKLIEAAHLISVREISVG